ncbi:hypothetical protein V2J09_019484 [Rumex salicifolius]
MSDELIEQVKNLTAVANIDGGVEEGIYSFSCLLSFFPLYPLNSNNNSWTMPFPGAENETNCVSNFQTELFPDGGDRVMRWKETLRLTTSLGGHIDDLGNQDPLPDFPMEDDLSFFSMSTENSMINQANMMETLLPLPSSSGSSKRKIVGGDGDTASSGIQGHKKTKL